jgi:hypothetical protein
MYNNSGRNPLNVLKLLTSGLLPDRPYSNHFIGTVDYKIEQQWIIR